MNKLYPLLLTYKTKPFQYLILGIAFLLFSQNLIAQEYLYWSGHNGKIVRSELDGSNVEDVLTDLERPQSMDIDNEEEKMFILIRGDDFKTYFMTANLDGTGLTTIIPDASTKSQFGFGLDRTAKKIYYPGGTDIKKANYDGSNIQIVVRNQPGTMDVVVDGEGGKLYWIDTEERKVKRANLDGSNIEDLITEGLDYPIEIDIDLLHKKIYWTDLFDNSIKRSNLDGSNEEVILDDNSFLTNQSTKGRSALANFKPLGLFIDPFGNLLYFSIGSDYSINKADLDGKNPTELYDIDEGSGESAWSVVKAGKNSCSPDTEKPVAKCKNISVELDELGGYFLKPIDVDNGSSDNCELNLEVVPFLVGCGDPKTVAVTLSATDDAGNTATCQAQVTIIEIDHDGDGVKSCADCDDQNPNLRGKTRWYLDNDKDSFGAESPSMEACDKPNGYVGNNTDCDDEDDEINPNTSWYKDSDGDGFGDANTEFKSCEKPFGYVSNNTDCDDTKEEIKDGETWYLDSDDDGFGDFGQAIFDCFPPPGYVGNSTDCNDNDKSVHEITRWYLDEDKDGFGAESPSMEACEKPEGYVRDNTDCDDEDDEINSNSIWYLDKDEDGFGDPASAVEQCLQPSPLYVLKSGDCNDNNNKINPFIDEILCNDIDDNCNGEVDEFPPRLPVYVWLFDGDRDGFGDLNKIVQACKQPEGYVSANIEDDCDDKNPDIHPGAPEICDGKDNDCDDLIDEEDPNVVGINLWYLDEDKDGFGAISPFMEACEKPEGYIRDNTDCDDEDDKINPNTRWYYDGDRDGYGDPANFVEQCNQPPDFVSKSGDCDDNDSEVNPDAFEECNGIDDDCNGKKDDEDMASGDFWYEDKDKDGFGNPNVSKESCKQPEGYVSNNSDCNDSDENINEITRWYLDNDKDGFGAESPFMEACEQPQGYVSNDTDCDDEDDKINPTTSWYRDNDGDGFGDPASVVGECLQPFGYVSKSGDCNDNNSEVNPDAFEECNGIDDDCNGKKDDEDMASGDLWYEDKDKDGFGNPNVSKERCQQPEGFVSNNLDCNDSDETNSEMTRWYPDEDKDGFGVISPFMESCEQPEGFVINNFDCDDNDKEIYPGAPEICDGKDNDCNGIIEEEGLIIEWYADFDFDGFGDPENKIFSCEQPNNFVANSLDCDDLDDSEGRPETWYKDADNDGFGNPDIFVMECERPIGFVENKQDCDDTDKEIRPGVLEFCNSGDKNCNGLIGDDDPELSEVGLLWHEDKDGDGFGTSNSNNIRACMQPEKYVSNDKDCDDSDPKIKDETIWYRDFDHDGFGTSNFQKLQCEQPISYVAIAGDCDDNDDLLHEMKFWYFDGDGDGFGNPNREELSCGQPIGSVANSGDCDDTNPNVKNGDLWYIDNDKDGLGAGSGVRACSQPDGRVSNNNDYNDNKHNIKSGPTDLLGRELSLFPNPVNSSLSVGYQNFQPVRLMVINVSGQIMMQFSNKNIPEKINTSGLVEGIYILTIIDKTGKSRTGRFAKVN